MVGVHLNATIFRKALAECWARVRAEGLVVGTLLRSGKVSPSPRKRPAPELDADTELNLRIEVGEVEVPKSSPTVRKHMR